MKKSRPSPEAAETEAEHAKVWAEEIAKRGKVRFIIHTEHHMDHWVTGALFGGEAIGHQATRDTMLTMDEDFVRERSKVLYSDPLPIPEGYRLRRPNLIHQHGLELYLGDHVFQIMHTPGHTAGQSAVYIPKEGVVFTGDNVMGEQITPIHDAILDKWVESLKVLQGLDVNYVLPGHGKVCDKGYLKTQMSIVEKLLEAEQEAKAGGRSLDQPTAREIDPYGANLDVGINPGLTVLKGTTQSLSEENHGTTSG